MQLDESVLSKGLVWRWENTQHARFEGLLFNLWCSFFATFNVNNWVQHNENLPERLLCITIPISMSQCFSASEETGQSWTICILWCHCPETGGQPVLMKRWWIQFWFKFWSDSYLPQLAPFIVKKHYFYSKFLLVVRTLHLVAKDEPGKLTVDNEPCSILFFWSLSRVHDYCSWDLIRKLTTRSLPQQFGTMPASL